MAFLERQNTLRNLSDKVTDKLCRYPNIPSHSNQNVVYIPRVLYNSHCEIEEQRRSTQASPDFPQFSRSVEYLAYLWEWLEKRHGYCASRDRRSSPS